MVGNRKGAAGEPFAADMPRRQNRFFTRLTQSFAVLILIDNSFAEDQHTQPARPLQAANYIVGSVAAGKRVEETLGLFGKDVEVTIEQTGGAEDDIAGKFDAAADLADGLFLQGHSASPIFQVAKLGALHENIRLQQADRVCGHRPLIDRDVIDTRKCCDGPCPLRLREDRAIGALIDKAVGSNRDDQNVAQLLSLFEVADVADMHQVEYAVAMRHHFARLAQVGHHLGQFLQRQRLAIGQPGYHRHRKPSFLTTFTLM